MTRLIAPSTRPRITAAGAKKIFRIGWDMAAFDYRQAQEIRDIFAQHGVRIFSSANLEPSCSAFPIRPRMQICSRNDPPKMVVDWFWLYGNWDSL
jgi:hypothetical protein